MQRPTPGPERACRERRASSRPSLSWPRSCIGRAAARWPAVPRLPLMASALAIAWRRSRDDCGSDRCIPCRAAGHAQRSRSL